MLSRKRPEVLVCQAFSARALQVRDPTYASNGGETSPLTATLGIFSRVLGASGAPETLAAASQCCGRVLWVCVQGVAWKKDNSKSGTSV